MAKQDTEMRVDEASSADAEAMADAARVYELGFHLDPNLPSEGVKKAYDEVRSFIAAKGAIVAEGEPIKIPLAYTISRMDTSGRRDFDSAHFSWIVYETTPDVHAEVVSRAGANTDIIRFIDLLTSKDSARHAAEMRELSLKVPETPAEAEEAATAELDAALENAAV